MYVAPGYDCGVYTMLYADCVCAAKLGGVGEREVEMMKKIGPDRARDWRKQTRALILSLAAKSSS